MKPVHFTDCVQISLTHKIKIDNELTVQKQCMRFSPSRHKSRIKSPKSRACNETDKLNFRFRKTKVLFFTCCLAKLILSASSNLVNLVLKLRDCPSSIIPYFTYTSKLNEETNAQLVGDNVSHYILL